MAILNITAKIHAKLKSSVEGDSDILIEALGNILLMDAMCNQAKVEWAKELIRAWELRGQKEMENQGL